MRAKDKSVSVTAIAGDSEEAEPPESLRLSIVEEAGDWSEIAALPTIVREAARALVKHPRCANSRGREATIVLADDSLLRSLNRTYRGKDAATNVLSFPFQVGSDEDGAAYLGDVVLAAETVAREAADQGVPHGHHFQHLVIHGVLHLLGFDHETNAEAEAMERIEIETLARLGIADPYSVSEPHA
jgi:probable rRNA maturation factor